MENARAGHIITLQNTFAMRLEVQVAKCYRLSHCGWGSPSPRGGGREGAIRLICLPAPLTAVRHDQGSIFWITAIRSLEETYSLRFANAKFALPVFLLPK